MKIGCSEVPKPRFPPFFDYSSERDQPLSSTPLEPHYMGLVYHCNIFSVYFFSFQIFACCLIGTRRDRLWTPWSTCSASQTGTSALAFRDFSSSSCFLLFKIFAFCLIAPQREGEASLARSPRRLIERAARGDTQLLPCYNNQQWKSKNVLPFLNNEQRDIIKKYKQPYATVTML